MTHFIRSPHLSTRCRLISISVCSLSEGLSDTLCAKPSQQSVSPGLLPPASPRVGRAPGNCGGWDRPRHHQFLPLRKHRWWHLEERNSLGIFPTSSGTHRNIPRSSKSDSSKNICRNVISWNTVKSCTNRGKCYVTVRNIPRWHNNTSTFFTKLHNRCPFRQTP